MKAGEAGGVRQVEPLPRVSGCRFELPARVGGTDRELENTPVQERRFWTQGTCRCREGRGEEGGGAQP
jgi:hypothetical protein